jgi:hypothetical protein
VTSVLQEKGRNLFTELVWTILGREEPHASKKTSPHAAQVTLSWVGGGGGGLTSKGGSAIGSQFNIKDSPEKGRQDITGKERSVRA